MKKVRLAISAAVVALLAMLVPSPAQAYEGVDVIVSNHTVVGGEDVTITAEVEPNDIVCTTLTLEYDGQSFTVTNASSITRTFETDEVDEETETTATGTCVFDDEQLSGASVGGGGGGGTLGTLVLAPQTSVGTGIITLLPEDGDDDDDDGDGDGDGDGKDDNGALPDTGGERLAWLAVGTALVLAGGGVVYASRRRKA